MQLSTAQPVSKKAFFDSEFTGLSSDPRLISIGLVADSGEALYIEFTNGWSEEQCSTWVRNHVLPYLGDGEKRTRREAGERIIAWLSSFGTPVALLGETSWDTELLADLLLECGIGSDCFCLEELVCNSKEQSDAFEAEKQDYFKSNGCIQHHALADARAFHAAWIRVFGAGAP